MSNSTEANPTWPDTLDPEPDAQEQAWLATGPLALARAAPSTRADLAVLDAVTQVRRFDWPRLQTKPNRALLAVLLIAFGGCAWRFWDEFNGSWVLSWPLVIWLALALLTFNFLLGRYGEGLPLIGHSYAETKPAGLKLRLFYRRCPSARRFFHGWFNLFMLTWPRCYYISWHDVEQVGLFTAYYGLRVGTLYWVRIWSRDRYGYTTLVTPIQQQASELADLIVGQAHLSAWAELGEHSTDPLNPDLGVLSKDDHFRWRTDRRRISVHGAYSSVNAKLWRTPDPQPSRLIAIRPTWRTAVKLVVAIALILVALNYDYLISLSIWPPSSANLSINNPMPIPPLHEVWHAPVERSYYDSILFGGGKVVFVNYVANSYDASTGRLLNSYKLPNTSAGCWIEHAALSEDGNYLYYNAFRTDADKTKVEANNASCSSVNYELVAFDLRASSIAWQHPIGHEGVFALDPKHKLVIVSDDTVSAIALDAQSGNELWRGQALPKFIPPTPVAGSTYMAIGDDQNVANHIAVGGNTAYVEEGLGSSILLALDVRDGKTQWTKRPAKGFGLLADSERAYLIDKSDASVYSSNGDELAQIALQGRDATSVWLISEDYVLNNGLLWATGSYNGPFGNEDLLAFDSHSGAEVWRSPTFSRESESSSRIAAGNGMLYLVCDGELHAYASARLPLCICFSLEPPRLSIWYNIEWAMPSFAANWRIIIR